MAEKFRIKKEQLLWMEQEVAFLKTYRQKEVTEMIEDAKRYGNLPYNGEYEFALEMQRQLHQRVADYEQLLSNAVMVEEDGTEVPYHYVPKYRES